MCVKQTKPTQHTGFLQDRRVKKGRSKATDTEDTFFHLSEVKE